MKQIPQEFLTLPIVYAVKDSYQIIVPVSTETVMWVEVGGKCFYDDSNGILRSSRSTHIVKVPMELLNTAKQYTVWYRVVHERKPYFTESSEPYSYTSCFRPIESETVNIYHISDAHNEVERPVAAGSYFGEKLDLLILNGDIPNHSGDISYFTAIHQIAAQLTNGEIPVIFSRGNHDMRGIYAEKLEEHTPTDNGKSYFTFRLGHLWGVVLDCAEDKADSHPAYGFMNCCEDFRQRETQFLKDLIADSKNEYEAEGIKNRIVVSHTPFTQILNIECETYTEWATLLREHVKPQIMICGHIHETYVSHIGSQWDHHGQPCPVIVAAKKKKGDMEVPYVGGAITLSPERCRVVFNNHEGCVVADEEFGI